MTARSVVARALFLLLALASLLTLPACSTFEDLAALREQAVTERDRLDHHAVDLESALAATPPDDPARAQIEAELQQTRARSDLHSQDIAHLDSIIAQARNPSDPIAQAVGVVAPFLPVPIRTPLVLGGALIGALLRMHQLRQGLTSVARGFEIAKRDDPDFNARFAANAPIFRATQTPLARKLINTAIKGT